MSYESSRDYLGSVNIKFDLHEYYYYFCDGFTKEQTEDRIKKDVRASIFDLPRETVNDLKYREWRDEQVNNDFPMLSSSKATAFWINLTRDQNEKATQFTYISKQRSLLEGDESDKTKSKQQAELVKEVECRVVEGDTLVKINNRSLSSILKSKGKLLFQSFDRLDADNKAICAYCLNGILDMTNISTGQKRLFSQHQWEYLQKVFDGTQDKHLPRLSSKINKILDKIKKMILDGDPEKAYYLVLSSVVDFPKHEQWILKILYHIINAYNQRSYIFTATKDTTEFDYMAKIWCELFELMFDQDAQYLKWGESVSNTTTAAKKANNDNSKNTIGCKVDGRILCRIDSKHDTLDICQIEAAKSTQDHAKNILDRAKLAIETKCIIDDTVTRPNFSTSVNQYQVQSVQLCGIQAQVSCLTLVDKGLYVHTTSHTISLKQDILEFAKDMKKWTRRLMKFKNTCYLNMVTYSSSTITLPKDINEAFGYEQPTDNTDHYCNASWISGTFLLPTRDKSPLFPKKLLTSFDIDITPHDDISFIHTILEDGTLITQRPTPRDSVKKRNHHEKTDRNNEKEGQNIKRKREAKDKKKSKKS